MTSKTSCWYAQRAFYADVAAAKTPAPSLHPAYSANENDRVCVFDREACIWRTEGHLIVESEWVALIGLPSELVCLVKALTCQGDAVADSMDDVDDKAKHFDILT